jgi:uncharacterized protein (TIGR02453 family)
MAFDTLISTARTFYTGLAANNTRDWWLANKSTYDTGLKAPALALLDDMIAPLSDLAGAPVTPKLFRPHRDVRFSKDKTPYNTHLHMMWAIEGGGRQDPAFFFGIAPDYVIAGGGVMGFDKPMLEDWRTFVGMDAKRVAPVLHGAQAQGFTFWEPELKKVPAPYPADHLLGEFLRMKRCVGSRDLGSDARLPDDMLQAFLDFMPVLTLLQSVSQA